MLEFVQESAAIEESGRGHCEGGIKGVMAMVLRILLLISLLIVPVAAWSKGGEDNPSAVVIDSSGNEVVVSGAVGTDPTGNTVKIDPSSNDVTISGPVEVKNEGEENWKHVLTNSGRRNRK